MEGISPRLWPYAANNSPLPLPSQAVLFTPSSVVNLNFGGERTPDAEPLNSSAVIDYARGYEANGRLLDDVLMSCGAEPLEHRRPILLQGELANPYRLQEMGMTAMPLLPVRLEDLCRTWADGLDPRDDYPGIHHVTLARTPGWWEASVLGLATKEQLKRIRTWLDNGVPHVWRPVKLAEGAVRFEHEILDAPAQGDVEWDGTTERVSKAAPPPTGPRLLLDDLLVVVHTRQGCYNHRGRLARCVHMQQRAFHDQLFRKGSSHRWNEVLSVR
jgi:hypothetical protein